MTHPEVRALLDRSNRLGADPRNTNYAGGNTSAKGSAVDPVTGEQTELLWVKGSGGDLGTLTEPGLAVLRLDRLRALAGVYPGVEREDEMVAAFDFCLHGKGGAAPSIDTAMHGLLDAEHVDHLHPDAGIAFATAADGEALTKECFGERVVWVPWRRPGFQLGLDIAAIKAANPQAIGVILGGHGITAWGASSAECEARSLEIIRTAQEYLDSRGAAEPFGPPIEGYQPLPPAERRVRAAALAPVVRGLASTDRAQIGHFTDADVVLDFLAREKHPAIAALGTSCPDHFLRTKVRPLVLDLPPTAPLADVVARLRDAAPGVPGGVPGVLRPARGPRLAADARGRPGDRAGARRRHVLLRPGSADRAGGRRVLRQRDQRGPRRGGDLHATRRSRSRRSSGSSTGSWRRPSFAGCRRRSRSRPGSRWSPAPARASARAIARRLAAEGACVIVADLNLGAAETVAGELGARAVPVHIDVTDSALIDAAFRAAALAFGGVDLVVNNAGLSISKSLLETEESDWDVQHRVMARGSFLVARAAARMMIDQRMGGDIIYIASKNAVFAGPNNVAYGAAKADQAHQVRLLAAELGEHQIRVNGVNPDGVVRGSGIFASGWGAQRAAVYGVPEEELGKYYAGRTLLKQEVLPEHVAAAVFALTSGDLPLTTGLHIPVDAGVAAAFLR